jgi:RecA/RadA recombinase
MVVDSIAGLIPVAEIEEAAEQQFIGNQAKLVTRCVRNLKQAMIKERKRGHPCAVLFTNQMRKTIGQMFVDPETMSGGHAMKHEFSLLIRTNKKSMAVGKDSADVKYYDDKRKKKLGQRFAFSIRKAKLLTLAGTGEYVRILEGIPELHLATGMVDDYNTVMLYAKSAGLVEKSGSSWKSPELEDKKTLEEIKTAWRKDSILYHAVQRQIIDLTKESLADA